MLNVTVQRLYSIRTDVETSSSSGLPWQQLSLKRLQMCLSRDILSKFFVSCQMSAFGVSLSRLHVVSSSTDKWEQASRFLTDAHRLNLCQGTCSSRSSGFLTVGRLAKWKEHESSGGSARIPFAEIQFWLQISELRYGKSFIPSSSLCFCGSSAPSPWGFSDT